MEKILCVLSLFVLIGCSGSSEVGAELVRVKKELEECRANVAKLENTPQSKFTIIEELLAKGEKEKAAKEMKELITKFPNSQEALRSNELLISVEKEIIAQKELEEKKKTLGFKMLSESNMVSYGEIKMSFSSVTTGGRWVSNAYGDTYHYRDSERGNKMILAKLSITSKEKNPNLPPILVYKMIDGKLVYTDKLKYSFSRWSDYGAYLGNYQDYRNDFAHTSTIPFSCGVEISEEDLNTSSIFIVVKKKGCFFREEDRFGNPPVRYVEGTCGAKDILTVDDFDKEYHLIKIFNKAKL
ncbi:hypothetical protein [Bergeyella zoohelcum]|uniref:Lipoprotein n=1 Tax=Bergeyella zoohelcum TaxID=1015 RepID=A0A376BY43_9FLAO|nr:hypothetical protein [Bergeyella zoohelcum]EKB61413.1 hypothetical protein HMPREF9700_00908 [Bergeyella zoohelcum CCUG 30536]SSZ46495.1 Uncharacterised protein [Bergeyella zoohelcum]